MRSELGEAETCFRTATALNPNNPLYYRYLVRVDEAKGLDHRQVAREDIAKLLALDPKSVDGRLQLAIWAKEEGDLSRARVILEQVIGDDPKAISPRVLLATIYYRMNLREQAKEQQAIAAALQKEVQSAASAPVRKDLPDPD